MLLIVSSIRRGPKSAPEVQTRKADVKSTQQRFGLLYQKAVDSFFIPIKMKPFASLVIALLPLLAVANPIANPDPAKLEARDKLCSLDGKHTFVNCRKGAGTGYDIVRRIYPWDNFYVTCKAYGEVIEGYRYWDYIGGWNCWVTAAYTNDGCEGKS